MPSERDKERYELLSKSGISPADFYRQVREDGTGRFDAYVLLRDLYNLNLAQCTTVAKAVEGNAHP